MIIYNKYTGEINSVLSNDQDPLMFFKDFPEEFKDSIGTLDVEIDIRNLQDYKIVNNQIVERNLNEVQELKQYGRVLTDEERLNLLLRPSQIDIDKAESTLEILTMLQEVGLI